MEVVGLLFSVLLSLSGCWSKFNVKLDGHCFGWPGAQSQGQACYMVVFCVALGARLKNTQYFWSASGPRQGETPLFASLGPQAWENLVFWGHARPRGEKKRTIRCPKGCQQERENKTHTFVQLLLSSSILKCLFNGFRCQMYQKCVQNAIKKRNPFRGHAEHEKLCFDCAGASGPRVGPSRKQQKKVENATCETTCSGLRFFAKQMSTRNIEMESVGILLGRFWRPGHPRHMTSLPIGAITPKTRENTTFLIAQVCKHCKTLVLNIQHGIRRWGRHTLLGLRKTTIWHLTVMFC